MRTRRFLLHSSSCLEPCPKWPYDVGAKANMKQVLNMSTLPLTNGVDNWQIAPSEQKDNEVSKNEKK